MNRISVLFLVLSLIISGYIFYGLYKSSYIPNSVMVEISVANSLTEKRNIIIDDYEKLTTSLNSSDSLSELISSKENLDKSINDLEEYIGTLDTHSDQIEDLNLEFISNSRSIVSTVDKIIEAGIAGESLSGYYLEYNGYKDHLNVLNNKINTIVRAEIVK